MPAFNAAAYIDDAISSAVRQTFRDFELLIVDDGSTDTTREVIQGWIDRDARVTLVAQPNRGISAARNAALKRCRGRYVALLDSDDAWDDGFLAAHLALLDAAPEIAIVTSNVRYAGGVHDGETMWPVERGRRRLELSDLLADEGSVCIMSVFRRDVYDTIGGFDVSFPTNEDYHFWLRAARAGFAIVQAPEPLGRYRRRPDSVSANQAHMLTGIIRVLSEARDWCIGREPETAIIASQLARFERDLLLLRGKLALMSGEFGRAHSAFATAARLNGTARLRAATLMSRWAPRLLRRLYGLSAASREPGLQASRDRAEAAAS
jgi:glycosyltransferase involved in cell wall biosynthesis